jgi:CRP/FNR family transcriptional regulator, cyclic AMP receptor protein
MAAVAQEVLFDLLSPQSRAWLASQGQRKTYEDGALVHSRGDSDAAMGIVILGQVRLFQLRPNGSHTFVSMIQPGTHYGDILLFAGKQRTHDAMAIGPTVVDHYGPAAFARLLEQPEITRALYKITAVRLGRSMAMTDDLRVLPRDAHLAKVLLNQWRLRGDSDWITSVQEDLAGMVGVTTMTLSKSLARLRELGFIETGYRKIRVLDPDALKVWLKGRIAR